MSPSRVWPSWTNLIASSCTAGNLSKAVVLTKQTPAWSRYLGPRSPVLSSSILIGRVLLVAIATTYAKSQIKLLTDWRCP